MARNKCDANGDIIWHTFINEDEQILVGKMASGVYGIRDNGHGTNDCELCWDGRPKGHGTL
jgi:hypothetical protein